MKDEHFEHTQSDSRAAAAVIAAGSSCDREYFVVAML